MGFTMSQHAPHQQSPEIRRWSLTGLWIWLPLLVLSIFYGTCLTRWASEMRRAYTEIIPGCQHAVLTRLVLACPWWPYGIALICLAFWALTAAGRLRKDTALWSALFVVTLESILLFTSLFGYCIPMIHFFGQGGSQR
jgi:hypothetical protein